MSQVTDILRKVSEFTGKPFKKVKESYYRMPSHEQRQWIESAKESLEKDAEEINKVIDKRKKKRFKK